MESYPVDIRPGHFVLPELCNNSSIVSNPTDYNSSIGSNPSDYRLSNSSRHRSSKRRRSRESGHRSSKRRRSRRESSHRKETPHPHLHPHPGDFCPAGDMWNKNLVCSDGGRAGIEILRGKIVGFVIVRLCTEMLFDLKSLREAYDEIRRTKGDVFELVLVAVPSRKTTKDGEGSEAMERIHNIYYEALMPLAVPLDDLEWREHLFNNYIYNNVIASNSTVCQVVLFDRKGCLLEKNAWYHFHGYGPAYYPFTEERRTQIIKKRREALRSNSLQAILGSCRRDFVISCHDGGQTKVTISQLKGTVIGVYFNQCTESPRARRKLQKLFDIYRQLKSQGRSFEIVWVNLDFHGGYNEETCFCHNLRQMPWLALPFKDEKIRDLFDTLFVHTNTLAIIGADDGGEFAYPHGFQVLKKYGIQAYPFTLAGAVKAKMTTLNRIQLRDAFKSMNQPLLIKKVGRCDYEYYPVNSLHGKRVIFFLMADLLCDDQDPLHKGNNRLVDLYEKDGSFQVVVLPQLNNWGHCRFDKAWYDKVLDTIPVSWFTLSSAEAWFTLLSDDMFLNQVWRGAPFHDQLLLAFSGTSGKLLRMGTLESLGCDAKHFPFITHENFVQILNTLLPHTHGWRNRSEY